MSSFPKPPLPLELSATEEAPVLELLDRAQSAIPTSRLVEIGDTYDVATVLGDTHGDWPTLQSQAQPHLISRGGAHELFILLGDYVDRGPPGLRLPSLTNALYLLSLLTAYPDRVVALRGNHEARRHVALPSSDIEGEALRCWGNTSVSERLEDLFERMPLAAITESGAYLAHAGFPMSEKWRESLTDPTEQTWLEVLWNDVKDSPTCGQRGIDQVPIDAENLRAFLARAGADVFLRGHDPWVAGRRLYGNRLLTVHSSRVFERYGLFVATIPLQKRIGDLSNVKLEQIRPAPLTEAKWGRRSAASPSP